MRSLLPKPLTLVTWNSGRLQAICIRLNNVHSISFFFASPFHKRDHALQN